MRFSSNSWMGAQPTGPAKPPSDEPPITLRLFTDDSPEPPEVSDDDPPLAASTAAPPSALSPSMRLSGFYREYFRPVILVANNAAAANLKQYDESMAYWVKFTGDPTLAEIDQGDPRLFDGSAEAQAQRVASQTIIAKFKAGLWTIPGLRRGTKVSVNTVLKHITHVQPVLDRTGSGTRKKPGTWLISPPLIEKPAKPDDDPHGILELEEITRMLGKCEIAVVPRNLAITAGVWWLAILWFVYNTALRIGTVRDLTWSAVEYVEGGAWLNVPRPAYKGGGHKKFWLNEWAIAALKLVEPLKVDGTSLIFPFKCVRTTLYDQLKLIMTAAGIPEERSWGVKFHGVRKCTATELTAINATAATIVLGHSTADMARKHYVNRNVAQAALAQMPQPYNGTKRP